jgi:hypothetical protein
MLHKRLVLLSITLVLLAFSALPASANILTSATATADCSGYTLTVSAVDLQPANAPYTVDFTFNLSCQSTPVTGSITINASDIDSNGNATVTASGSWPSSPLNTLCSVSGMATLTSSGSTQNIVINGQTSATLSCGPPSGKTFHIGPSSMEGNLFIHAGDFVSGGYSFSFVENNHPATTYTVSATVTVPVTCPQGGGQGGNITVDLGTVSYGVPAGNTNWLPTGDQNSILSWQGSTVAPDLCGGNVMNNQHGAIFVSTVSQSPSAGLVNWRFKYRDPAAKGKPNTDCTNASDPNRNRADVCGASWSQTVRDP